jgi:Fe-S-cluster containining protein
MDTKILNPENAEYFCNPGCGDCCYRYVQYVFPSEAFALSEAKGISLRELVRIKNEPFYSLRLKSPSSFRCLFLNSNRECEIHEEAFRPWACQVHPLNISIVASVASDSMKIIVHPHEPCDYGRIKIVPSREDLIELAARGIRMYAAAKFTPQKEFIDDFCRDCYDAFQKISLEEAVRKFGDNEAVLNVFN